MLSNSFNWTQSQADLLRRAARCAPLWGASGKTAFYERGLFTGRWFADDGRTLGHPRR